MSIKPTFRTIRRLSRPLVFLVWILSIPSFLPSQSYVSPGSEFQQYRYSRDFRFRRLGVEEGLSNPYVTEIFQDRQGFIWVATADGLNRFDGYQFRVFRNVPEDPLSLSDNRVTALLEDSNGFIWVGTEKGLNRFDPYSEHFLHFFADTVQHGRLRDDHIRCLFMDRSGQMWIGTNKGGLHVFNPDGQTFECFRHVEGDPASLGDNCVKVIEEDRQGNLYLGTMGGLSFFDKGSRRFKTWTEDPENLDALCQNWVNAVLEDPEGYIWAGATNGLNRFDPETGLFQWREYWPNTRKPFWLGINGHRIQSLFLDRDKNIWIGTQWGGLYRFDWCQEQFFNASFDIADQASLSDNVVNCIYQDREGTLWVGTEAGLSLLYPYPNPFHVYTYNPADTNSIKDVNVNTFLEESIDRIWIGTDRGGLMEAPSDFSYFRQHPLGRRWFPMIKDLLLDSRENYWVATFGSGFARFDRSAEKFQGKFYDPSNRSWILTLLEDSDCEVWFGSLGGLNCFDPETWEAAYFPFAPEDPLSRMTSAVTAFVEGPGQTFFVGTSRHGLKRFDRIAQKYEHYPFGSEDGHGTKSAYISFIFEDHKKRIWVGTGDEGFYLFDPAQRSFRPFSEADGLPSNALTGMVEDDQGYLWITTGKGLSRFDPTRKTFRNYNVADGLPANALTSIYRGPYSGRIYLGTTGKGFGVFHPGELSENTVPPPVVISSLQRIRRQGDKMVLLDEKGISAKDAITLTHRDHIVTFEVAALSYLKSGNNQYAYLLEGFNNDWIPLGTKREFTFTSLHAGQYTLRVKASNGDGVWNEKGASLVIRVLPPWYASAWAYVLYLFLGGTLLLGLYRFQLSRRLAESEASRLKELDAFKNRLFTNITHEFRTPLTIIGGMASQIREDPERWMGEGLDMIERNSSQLLSLVTQVLDLAKLEAGSLPLKMQQGDILVNLKYLLESFHSFAESKGINLSFESTEEEIFMDYDPEKIQQIVSNLLSNAIKFTPDGGRVWMHVSTREIPGPTLLILVGDSGPGIPEEKLPKIFERFFQGDGHEGGTGIGLALTSELLKLLGGNIDVESRIGAGSIFSVVLPITREASQMAYLPQPVSTTIQFTKGTEKLPQILIVEDNHDVVSYLFSCLEGAYRLEVAYDGKQGIEKAITLVPDLVISDVMMPEKDGFEVCDTLKTDLRTCHIPIILLTAKADVESRLQGLECGADVYLPKPFDKTELLVQLRKLIELRETLRSYYLSLNSTTPLVQPENVSRVDDVFVQSIFQLVEEHLDDVGYTVDQLSRDLNVSYSQLHRKLSALTGYSANHFIRYIRLCEAQRLLKNSDLQIAEVAFQTGFEDPAYFARVFKKEFGMTPSEWRED